MKYRKDRYGNEISQLGYGCMRFTKKGSGIDYEKAEKEVMLAIEQGVNYFDTAYIYSGSGYLVSSGSAVNVEISSAAKTAFTSLFFLALESGWKTTESTLLISFG